MTRKPSLLTAAMTAALLALPAAGNPLLNERWIAKASYEQVQKAIAGGGDPNAVRGGFTPLKAAANFDNKDAMRALCEAGADGDMPAKPGTARPLHHAADAEAVALLHDCGALVWSTDSYGSQPLHYAAMDSRLSSMEALIRRGADVDARDRIGNTSLHDAAKYGHPAAVQILLEAGADVNARNRSDATPLHKAARHNIPEVVQILLEAGADPTIHANNRFVSSMVPSPAEAARGNRKLRGHPVMARLEVGMTTASPSPGCDGYVVLPTDRRLGDVAEKVLGDRSRWTEIARLNGITAQAPHRVGQCLALP